MKSLRVNLRFVLLIVGLTLSARLQAGAIGDEEAKPDAAAILSKAADQVDLHASNGPPFLLIASVSLQENNKTVNGVFAMTSASAGQYRRVFRFPGFTATEVVTEGVMYRQRSSEALPLMIWELDQLLALVPSYRPGPQWKLRGVDTERSGSTDLTCVVARAKSTDSKICVDAATGRPFSIDRGTDFARLPTLREHFEFADYQPFEGRTFPRKLTFRGWGAREIEVQIQKLVRVQSFQADEFTPPKGASRTRFCQSPETAGDIRPNTGNTIPFGFTDLEVDMYFQVSPAGGVQYAQVVYSSDPLKNNEILHWFLGTHFPVETCSGTPVSYETVVRLVSGH